MSQTTTPAGTRTVEGRQVPEAGTYTIDRAHSMVEFVGRYLMVSKVRGRFGQFSGQIRIGDDPRDSSVEVTVDATSIDTRDEMRDGHLKNADFLDVEKYPTLEFRSTGVTWSGNEAKVHGDLTLHGVTRPVTFDLEYDGSGPDPWGNTRIAFTASAEIDREDWGLTWNKALETGGVLIGRKVTVDLTIQATKQ